MVASAHSDPHVAAAAKDYVDEQGLSNLEAAIALIPPAVEAPPAERDWTGRDDEPHTGGV